ncbi:MAG: transcription antitermination factor NusB [Lachnospiraceae bacterium]|nr:transcription antitermination factor NusB [Lachnospiraceae bacterium]MDD3659108.1 transcription antitermination factor NusB [Lachnospiraceae bacterium]
MGRRELREQIFKLLFRIEFNKPEEMEEQEKLFFEDDEKVFSENDQEYITQKYGNIVLKKSEIDTMINEIAEGWKTERMGKVDLTILRLAVYEIRFDEDVPTSVAINEAVELAKKYGQDGSPSFVNGILAKFAK